MGVFYLEGKLGVKTDIKLAIEYFEMAAAQNFQLSIINLAEIFLTGANGVDSNPSKVISYLNMVTKWDTPELEKKASELKDILSKKHYSPEIIKPSICNLM